MSEMTRFFRSRWVELLIAGVWLQSVVSAVFTGNLALMAVTALGGLVVIAVIFWLVDRLRRRRPPVYGDSEAFQVPRQALVCTVGMQKETILFSVGSQQPAWLGLVCTRRTEPIADDVVAASGLDPDHVQKEIVDPWNVVEVREKTFFVLDWLARHGVEPAGIAIDITGATAIMSAGAFSVAAERQVDCQYVRSDYDGDNRPVARTQRGVFVARYEREQP